MIWDYKKQGYNLTINNDTDYELEVVNVMKGDIGVIVNIGSGKIAFGKDDKIPNGQHPLFIPRTYSFMYDGEKFYWNWI